LSTSALQLSGKGQAKVCFAAYAEHRQVGRRSQTRRPQRQQSNAKDEKATIERRHAWKKKYCQAATCRNIDEADVRTAADIVADVCESASRVTLSHAAR
jgi:hypothetical protein